MKHGPPPRGSSKVGKQHLLEKRHFLRSVGRALIAVVLLAQLAVSAYACPGLLSAAAPSSIDAAAAAPPAPPMNCEDMAEPMDAAFANLCAAHCQQGQQSDHTATVAVPAVLLTALYTMPLAADPCGALRPASAAPCARAAASPPLAILHCCLRI